MSKDTKRRLAEIEAKHAPATDAEIALYCTFVCDGVENFDGSLLGEVLARLSVEAHAAAREAAAVAAFRDASDAEIVSLRQSLLMAESWFRDYAELHIAKVPPDAAKAAINAERAQYCHDGIDAAIAEAAAIRQISMKGE